MPRAVAAGVVTAVTALSRSPLIPPDRKKNCVPYCSVSFSVTSAMVASMRTCIGTMSIFRSMARTVSSSSGVPKIRIALFCGFGRIRIVSAFWSPPD